MHAFMEMVGLEKTRHSVARLVVDENGAQERLLGFDIVRRLAVFGFGVLGVDRSKLRLGIECTHVQLS